MRKAHTQRKRIIFDRVLVYYDGPQLSLFSTKGSAKVVGSYTDDDNSFNYFGAEISEDQWEKYEGGATDLRYLFLRPKYKRWYKFNIEDTFNGGVMADPLNVLSDDDEDLLPDSGFFSRDHTEQNLDMDKLSSESYNVDGNWELSEFSKFYAKVGDIYSYLSFLRTWSKSVSVIDEVKRLKSVFSQPWLGGGSYVNFFNELSDALPRQKKLRVGSIQYASPGHVRVKGSEIIFKSTRTVLQMYSEDKSEIDDHYKSFRKYLSRAGHLNKRAKNFNAGIDERRYILAQSIAMERYLGIYSNDILNDLCDGNEIMRAKVVLAFYRRVSELHKFFDEGRLELRSIEDNPDLR